MNISYFQPENPNDDKKKKDDNSLITPKKVMEGAIKKAQKMEESKNNTGLMPKNEGKLLTDDGREIINEKK